MDYEESLKQLPLFVSFPRSGCNWIQPVIELYFNRHRMGKVPSSPSWMEGDDPMHPENPMWTHTHDPNGLIVTDKPAVFLYRNPVDAIYSLSELMNQRNPASIERFCAEYKRLYDKWAKGIPYPVSHGTSEVLVINYEAIKQDPHGAMSRINDFWGVDDFDHNRSLFAFNTAGDKHTTNGKGGPANYKNPRSGSDAYEEGRIHFKAVWQNKILNLTGMANND